MIKEGDISLINQLMRTLEDAFDGLEKAYREKDSENFNKFKRIIIQMQRRISVLIK